MAVKIIVLIILSLLDSIKVTDGLLDLFWLTYSNVHLFEVTNSPQKIVEASKEYKVQLCLIKVQNWTQFNWILLNNIKAVQSN